MANKRKYADRSEYEKAMQKKRNEWNKANYRRLNIVIEPELSERLDEASKRTGESKRQIVIKSLENFLKTY